MYVHSKSDVTEHLLMATKHLARQRQQWLGAAGTFKTTTKIAIPSFTASYLPMSPILVPLNFTEATEKRRSLRALTSKTTVDDKVIVELAKAAIRNVPSAFNNQSARMTIVFGADHQKLWSITADALLARIGSERWNSGTKTRISGFAGGYGTIMFWDDGSCVDA